MNTVSINLYTFEELAHEVQKKVVERERSINVEDSYWYEPIIEDWTEELQQRGFEQVKILFCGFGSQGDGACFEARINRVVPQ
jgi:elongation factor P hydroxylase